MDNDTKSHTDIDPFKVQDKPTDFNVAQYKFIDTSSDAICLVLLDFQRRLFLRLYYWICIEIYIVDVKSLRHVQLLATPWTAACQASFTISQSLLKLLSFESVIHPTISSSVIPFSSCLLSFLASGSFPRSQFFASGGQTIEAWALASVLPMNIQSWFPLGLTSLILLSRWLSRVFFSTTIQNYKFFSAQPSLWSSSQMHTWLLENHSFD